MDSISPGGADSLAELYDRYAPRVERWVRRLAGPPFDANTPQRRLTLTDPTPTHRQATARTGPGCSRLPSPSEVLHFVLAGPGGPQTSKMEG